MTEDKRTSPELRFKAEDGSDFLEWEEKKLGDLIKSGGAGGTPVATDSSMYNGPFPFLGISDMTEQGKYLTHTSKSLTQKGIDNSAAWLVPDGHLIYAMYASVGKVAINTIPLATSQAMFSLKLDDSFADLEYVYYVLDKLRDSGLKKFITTGTQGNINAETLKSLPIPLPSLPEQKKIAEFFSLLDERISKQADKVASLREYKKGLSQRIFSRELRFKDENGEDYPEWEEKKLGEVADLLRGGSLSKADLSTAGKPCILYGELYTKYGEVIREVSSKTNAIEKGVLGSRGDVIMPSSGESPWDIVTASALSVDSTLLSGDMTIIRRKSDANYNSEFLARYIKTTLKPVLAKKAQGASVTHLYSSDIAPVRVAFPSLPEQEKIAKLLSIVDSKITKEEEKLEALRKQKRGLMQRIFV